MPSKENVIDCFGDICPIPVLKVQDALKALQPGEEFTLVTDHSCVVKSIEEKYNHQMDLELEYVEPMNGVWEITFRRK